MKKKLCIVYSAVLICFSQFVNALDASQAVADHNAQEELYSSQIDSSIDLDSLYPINANKPIWAKLGTEEKRFEKTQLEPAVINEMNTDTLLDAVIGSPMVYTVEYSADRDCGAITFAEKTNAGKELLKREDLKEAVLKEYLSLEIPKETLNDYSEISNRSGEDLHDTVVELLEDKEFSENVGRDINIYHKIHFLEGIILSDEFYSTLSVEEKSELYRKSLILNEEKQKSEVFSYSAEESFSLLLMEDDELAEYIDLPEN